MKKQKTKNGAERRNKIFAYVTNNIFKPMPFTQVLKKMKRRKEFSDLNFSTFTYNVKILIEENLIYSEKNNTLHPKKKPIFLIRAKQLTDL